MRPSRKFTLWICERLNIDAALTGDLLEECARGRSGIWYWRQVLVAMYIGVLGTVRDHKLLALRAVATGFSMEYLIIFLWNNFSHLLPDWPVLSIQNLIFNFSSMLVIQAAIGRAIARTHRPHQAPMVLVFLACLLLWWIHRTRAFAGMVLLGSIDHPEYRPYLVFYLSYTLTLAGGVFIGGIFGARPEKQLPVPPDPHVA